MIRIFLRLSALVLTASLLPAQPVPPFVVKTVAGSNPLGDDGPATSALLEFPSGVAVDSSGNVFIADPINSRIRKVSPDGKISTFLEYDVTELTFDPAGNLLASTRSRIVRISPRGNVTTIAGTGTLGYDGDNKPATSARLNGASCPVLDSAGNIYFADEGNHRVRKISTSGTISTVAGNGRQGNTGDNGLATEATLGWPNSVTLDPDGNLYISDWYNRIRKVTPDGKIVTFAGNGGFTYGLGGDGGKALNAVFANPRALIFDPTNSTLYIADSWADRVRRVGADGIIRNLVGSGVRGFSGDSGMATAARLNNPTSLALDSSGNLYIADTNNHRIRKLTASNSVISTIAGRAHFDGDKGPAISALLQQPGGVAVDPAGNIYISDTWNHRIRKVAALDGTITTIAGTGEAGESGNGGPAVAAKLTSPGLLALDAAGNLYVETAGTRLRRIDLNGGGISAVAGTGSSGYSGDGVPATSAGFGSIDALAVDSAGNLWVSDGAAYRIRKISTDGKISTVVGDGTRGYSGDDGLAKYARINSARGLAFDKDGNLYIADSDNFRIRKVTAAGGVMSTVMGTGENSLAANGSSAATSPIGRPEALAFDKDGNFFINQPSRSYICMVSGGKLYRIAGNNRWEFAGESVLATEASFRWPNSLAVDSAGDVYIADTGTNRIRQLIRNTAARVEIADGDNQTGNAGDTLPKPLKVTLMGRGGLPVAGTPVAFAVTAGTATLSATSTVTDSGGVAGVAVTLGSEAGTVAVTATLSAASTVTDSGGVAGVTVTLGPDAGVVTVTATVAGLPPVRFTLTIQAGAGAGGATQDPPRIRDGGILRAGNMTPTQEVSPNGVITIQGDNFTAPGFSQAGKPQDGLVGTILGGTCVKIGAEMAPILYMAEKSANVIVPFVPVDTDVEVQVVRGCGGDAEVGGNKPIVSVRAATPEFSLSGKSMDGKALVSALDGSNKVVDASNSAKPGGSVTVYGFGFGPTDPPLPPGAVPGGAAGTVLKAKVSLGLVDVPDEDLLYAGVAPGIPGTYQLTFRIPASLPDGVYPMTLRLGDFVTPDGAYLPVKQ